MTRIALWAATATFALSSSSCTVGPDYVPPELDVPDAWHRELSEGLETGDADLHEWWKVLGDPLLEDLIARAAADNLDLEIAFQRVIEAQALRGIAAGNRWPDIEGFGSAFAREDAVRVNPVQGGNSYHRYSLGADAIWEVDVWGRVSRLIESADADLQATAEGYRDVLVLLFAQVAIEYVELRAQQERLRIAERNIELQEETLGLVRDRFDAGIVSELDVRQAELNLARTRSAVPRFRAAIAQTGNRIAVLLGENPGTLEVDLSAETAIPSAPDRVLVTGPIDALRRRPDVRQAERALAAQTARIGVAEAELYPQFTLFGSFGFDGLNGNASDMFRSDGISWAFGPQFRWNLFDGGRVQGNIDAEKARTEQALTAYRQTVLLALEEVENALIAYSEETARRTRLQESVAAAQRSVELVRTQYRSELVDFQNVLDMQRSLAQQEDLLAESEGLVVQALIRLYKALGGGWNPDAAADGETEPAEETR